MITHQTGKRKRALDHQGFTLIELMVTVALIGVLAGLSIATWFTGLNHASLRSDAGDIASALRKAKQLAITTNSPYQVYFDFINMVYEMESCGAPPATCVANGPPSGPFSGTVNHGALVGAPVNLTNLSFGHKPTQFIVNNMTSAYAQYASDGTVTFYNGSNGAQILPANPPGYINITLGRTDGNTETKVVNAYPSGRITVP